MDDLFGHRNVEIMPKTKALEAQLYKETPADREDYRGIKDMSFGIEEFQSEIENRGYLNAKPGPPILLGSGVPAIDSYIYTSIKLSYDRIFKPEFDEITKLKNMSGDDYKDIVNVFPSSSPNLTIDTFEKLEFMTTNFHILTDGLVDDVLEAVSEVCFTEFDVGISLAAFRKTSAVFEELCDNTMAILQETERGSGSREISFYEGTTRLNILQEDLDASLDLYTKVWERLGQLDRDVLNLLCKVQNITAHCIRIERDYNQFTPLGRPTKGELARFASSVTALVTIIDMYLNTLQMASNFVNVLIYLNDK